MDEYISRELAVEQITSLCELREIACGANDEFLRGLKKALITVKTDELIPSADVQPVKRGRWIDIYEWAKMHDSTPSGMCTYYWCSECQTEQEKRSNFCPNCGAKMDGDVEGRCEE